MSCVWRCCCPCCPSSSSPSLGLVREHEDVEDLLEKFLVANMVVRMAPLSFRLALNFFRHSTVSWRWRVDATRSLWQIQGCLRACSAVILRPGGTVSIELIRFFASGVTVSHSGDGYCIMRLRLIDRIKERRTHIISSSLDLGIKPVLVFVPKGRIPY